MKKEVELHKKDDLSHSTFVVSWKQSYWLTRLNSNQKSKFRNYFMKLYSFWEQYTSLRLVVRITRIGYTGLHICQCTLYGNRRIINPEHEFSFGPNSLLSNYLLDGGINPGELSKMVIWILMRWSDQL